MDIFFEHPFLLAILLPSLVLCAVGALLSRKKEPAKHRSVTLWVLSLLSLILCTAFAFAAFAVGGGFEHVLPALLLHLVIALSGGSYGI